MSDTTLTLGQLASFGEPVPLGEHTSRITKIDAKESQGEKPNHYVAMTLEHLDGEAEGLTSTIVFFPKVTISKKNGKPYSRGLFDAQTFAAAWGHPLSENLPLGEYMGPDGTTEKGAANLQKALFDSYKKAGQPRLRTRIVAERVREEKPQGSGKWVEATNDDGTPKTRNKCIIIGRVGNAPSAETAAAEAEEGASASLSFV